MRRQKLVHDGVVLFRLARARRVHERSSRRDDFGRPIDERPLRAPQRLEVSRRAAPLEIRIAPHRAQPGARRIEQHAVEHRAERQRAGRVKLDDVGGDVSATKRRPQQLHSAIPHVARAICGPDLRWVLPYSLLLGALLLLASDVVGRVVARPGELQVGIVTALVGAPVFIALVRRRRVAQL